MDNHGTDRSMTPEELKHAAAWATKDALGEILSYLPTRSMILERLWLRSAREPLAQEEVDRELDLYNLIPENIDGLTITEAAELMSLLRPHARERADKAGVYPLPACLGD